MGKKVFWGIGLSFAIILLFAKRPIEKKLLSVTSTRYSQLPKFYQVKESKINESALGFESALASYYWLKLLQGAEHTPIKRGEVSWEFLQLEKITALDPNFYDAYHLGAVYLSQFRKDTEGAYFFLDRWTRVQPQYWKTHYMLGYHLFFEMNKPELASKYILKAANLERAPEWLSSLGIRIFNESGNLFQSLQMSLDLYPSLIHDESKIRLSRTIRSLNYQIQKKMWVQKNKPTYSADKIPTSFLKTLRIPDNEDLKTLLSEKFEFDWDTKKNQALARNIAEAKDLENVGVYIPPHQQKGK
jgi:hypothetical protein